MGEGGGAMDVDDKAEGDKKEGEEGEKKEEAPKDHEIVHNPARVTMPQLAVIVFDQDERYHPVRPGSIVGSGVILLTDTKPDDEVAIVENSIPVPEGDEPEEDEPEPPAPFEYAEY